ncbi:MAG TPA: ferredoxin [Patescibacteria group bacterium]
MQDQPLPPADNQQPPSSNQPGTVMSTQQVGKYTIQVINNKCIGAASCVAIAPGTFKLNEQNIAEVISQTGDAPDIQLLAGQSCPTAAIVITDNETGQQVWPIE